MKLQIQALHFEAGETLINKITEKLETLETLYDRIEKCTVVLKHEKNDHKEGFMMEVRLAVPKEDLFCEERAESFEGALDHVMSDLKKQIIRHKEKISKPGKFHEKVTFDM